jgi:hypothetical protein
MKSSKTRRNTRKYGGFQPMKHKDVVKNITFSKSKSVRTRRNSNSKMNKLKSIVKPNSQ